MTTADGKFDDNNRSFLRWLHYVRIITIVVIIIIIVVVFVIVIINIIITIALILIVITIIITIVFIIIHHHHHHHYHCLRHSHIIIIIIIMTSQDLKKTPKHRLTQSRCVSKLVRMVHLWSRTSPLLSRGGARRGIIHYETCELGGYTRGVFAVVFFFNLLKVLLHRFNNIRN